MTNEEELTKLREIEARCNATTLGPWRNGGQVVVDENAIVVGEETYMWRFVAFTNSDTSDPEDAQMTTPEISKEEAKANADFIAHARTDIPELVARLRRFYELLEPFRTDEKSSVEILEKIIRVMKGLCDPTHDASVSEGEAG